MGKIMINGESYPSYVVKTGVDDTGIFEDKAWSSKKTSDEIAEVETELNANVTALSDRVKTVEDAYAKKTDIPTTLPANGGNSDTVNNHTVKSDVPENAVFTDTVYDDTEVKAEIAKKADKSYVDDNFATMDKVESKYEEATLDTPVDWNTLNTKARYYFSGGATMTNAPMQVPFGELVVETVGSVCRVQKFFSFDGKLYIRRWSGSVWNDWYRFDGISI